MNDLSKMYQVYVNKELQVNKKNTWKLWKENRAKNIIFLTWFRRSLSGFKMFYLLGKRRSYSSRWTIRTLFRWFKNVNVYWLWIKNWYY